MKLHIYNNAKQKISDNFFQKIFSESLAQLKRDYSQYEGFIRLDSFFVNLILVDNKEIQNLNKQWREKDSVTDVLSFPYVLDDSSYGYRLTENMPSMSFLRTKQGEVSRESGKEDQFIAGKVDSRLRGDDRMQECFGEIYICIPRAKLQAENLKHSFEKELSILFTHGILHIFAFNHIADEDFLIMNTLEKKIEKRLESLVSIEHKNRTSG